MDRKWWTLGAVCVATFMLLLDITVVNTALPAIREGPRRQLHRPAVGDRRLRALARRAGADAPARSPTGSDAGACSRSASGSSRSPRCSAALSPDPTFLNLARGLQGVGGAIMFAVSLALVAQEFPSRPRARRWRWGSTARRSGSPSRSARWSAALLTDGLGWQSVFLINVPIGLAAIAVTYWKLARVAATPTRPGSTGPASPPSRPRCSCWCWRWSAATTRAGAAR